MFSYKFHYLLHITHHKFAINEPKNPRGGDFSKIPSIWV